VAFHEVLAALRARWFLAALALLCAAAGGVYVLHGAPVYQADAAVVLVPPKEPSAPNSLASAGPSDAAAGLAVDDILLSPAETAALRAQGVRDAYTIVPRNNGTSETPAYRVPSEQFTVTGGNATTVMTETDTLIADYAAKLRAMQSASGVIVRAQITVGLLAPTTVARLHGSRSRGAVGIALLGFGAAVAAAVRFRPRRVRPGHEEGERERARERERTEQADALVV
jgi:hypothetical protein